MIESDSWTGKFALLIFVQTKKGWLVGLGQEELAWGWGELSKISSKGWNKKEGNGHKDFKRTGSKLSQGVGALKLVSADFCDIFIFSANDSPSKVMKNAFYFL